TVAKRDSLEDTEPADFVDRPAETASVKNTDDKEKNRTADDSAHRGGAAFTFDRFAKRENEGDADDENEERENEVEKGESGPRRMDASCGESAEKRGISHFFEGPGDGSGADDPKHVESAKGVDRHQAGGWRPGSGGLAQRGFGLSGRCWRWLRGFGGGSWHDRNSVSNGRFWQARVVWSGRW